MGAYCKAESKQWLIDSDLSPCLCLVYALTGAAINSFATNVYSSMSSVNSQITIVQANKYQEFQVYLANQIYLELLALYDEYEEDLARLHELDKMHQGDLYALGKNAVSSLISALGNLSFSSPYYEKLYQQYLDILAADEAYERDLEEHYQELRAIAEL